MHTHGGGVVLITGVLKFISSDELFECVLVCLLFTVPVCFLDFLYCAFCHVVVPVCVSVLTR